MPRIRRKISSTKVYHVILRGIDKQDIFFCDKDYYKFLEILKETKEKYKYDIYSCPIGDRSQKDKMGGGKDGKE
jgi:transposase